MKGHDGARLTRDEGMPPAWRAYWLTLSKEAQADLRFIMDFVRVRYGSKLHRSQAILWAIIYTAQRLKLSSPITDAGEEGGPPW